jgi:predicted RNase H-like nuclease (RuvC/YqgF family)
VPSIESIHNLTVVALTLDAVCRRTKLKQGEENHAVALERARQAEQILGRGYNRDQEKIAMLEQEFKQMRLRSLALQERVRQMNRLREDDRQTIARLESQLAHRENRILILESKGR